LEVPGPVPKTPVWPEELPLPQDARPLQYVAFPRRGTGYGSFAVALPAAAAFRAFLPVAEASGWRPTTAPNPEATGAVFVAVDNPALLMTVNFIAGRGLIFRRRLHK
ncbi:MAG: hypothetical protein PHQ27_05200, partial [Victivallales bacterium]|nr:hypothetical protein [Victivallales bacterium]